jgi:Putative DNA-binding domain
MPAYGEQVSRERLLQLLDHGEHADLDFKQTCDLNDRKTIVEMAKDVAAFAAAGGHIVVGVREDGSASGLFETGHAALFDEATLRPKLARYVPDTVSLACAVHDFDGNPVAVVFIAAHPNGFVVMRADGSYEEPEGTAQLKFKAGDVFVRRGSSSTPWNHSEAELALSRAMQTRREIWRRELGDELLASLEHAQQAQAIALGPAANFTWQIDNEAFTEAFVELLRANDEVALTYGLDTIRRDAAAAHGNGDADRLETIADRVASITAVSIAVRRRDWITSSIDLVQRLYQLPYDQYGNPRAVGGINPEGLWLSLITRVYALGALAVRKRDWDSVKDLSLRAPGGRENYHRVWLRHAVTSAARANLFTREQGGRRIELPLLSMAAEQVTRLAPLRPELPDGDEAILNSLTQFDLLSILCAIGETGSLDGRDWYTNFARYDWRRSEPAALELLRSDELRQRIFPATDGSLAVAINTVSSFASNQGFRYAVWAGWESQQLIEFLRANTPPE